MKKILYILLMLFAFIPNINVKAASIETSMSGVSHIDAKGSFSVTINISGNNVWGATMALSYDKTKLELIDYTGENGFTATVGSNIVLDSTIGHSGNFKAIVLTFKAKEAFEAGQSTKISVSNVQGASNTEVMSGSGTSKTITVNIPKSSDNNLSNLTVDGTKVSNFSKSVTSYDLGTTTNTSIKIAATKSDAKATVSGEGVKQLKYGVNTFNVVVTAENGSKKTYTIKITRPDTRSSNNSLESLSVSGFDLKFNKNTTSYTFTADHNITSVNITANASDAKATVSGTGTKTLKDYLNKFSIVVTAENGSKKTYTITINRKDDDGNLGKLSNDNSLKSLTIEGFELEFNKDQTNYTLEVDNSINNVLVKAEANDSKATININNIEVLAVGNNLITIDVTAEDGSKKTYNLNVVRKSDAPVTTIDKLESILGSVESNQIIIEIKDNNAIFNERLIEQIKNSGKDIVVNKYDNDNNIIYSWSIEGKSIKDIVPINTNIKFNSDNFDAISELTNYADAVYLNFEHSGDLPDNTKIKVYVGDRYKNGDLVNIYYFNEEDNKMEKIEMKVEVADGYVEFEIEHCSEYIITRSAIQHEGTNIFMITAIIEAILLIGLIIFIILDKTNKINFKFNK